MDTHLYSTYAVDYYTSHGVQVSFMTILGSTDHSMISEAAVTVLGLSESIAPPLFWWNPIKPGDRGDLDNHHENRQPSVHCRIWRGWRHARIIHCFPRPRNCGRIGTSPLPSHTYLHRPRRGGSTYDRTSTLISRCTLRTLSCHATASVPRKLTTFSTPKLYVIFRQPSVYYHYVDIFI